MEVGNCNVDVDREDLSGKQHLSQNFRGEVANYVPIRLTVATARLKSSEHECAWDVHVRIT